MTERWEWVEIVEPRTQEHMYANLTTGECVWDPPPGVRIKKTDDNQWWELFDQKTSRFYYYNATSQRTVWHRPQNCDIIPLAKLQTLKQNTEVRDDLEARRAHKKEISTQTPERTPKKEHNRTGSIRQSHSTQTSPHQNRKHHHHRHHHHHHHQKPDVALSRQVSQPEVGGDYVNGERSRRRRGSQSSQTSLNYVRRESVEAPQRSLESPRPQRSLDLNKRTLDLHRGSVDHVGSPVQPNLPTLPHPPWLPRQDSYSKDDYIGYAREVSHMSSQYPDVSQITAVQVTPRPKPRAFPRTNPAYVGVHRRDGQPSYKRINIEQPQPPTAIYNQRFYDAHSQPSFESVGLQTASIQTSQTCFSDLGDRQFGVRPERSDSDTSHSSYGLSRLHHDQMTDSLISQGSFRSKHPRDLSDSHSSQGSLRGMADSHSSQGSLRSVPDREPGGDLAHQDSPVQHSSASAQSSPQNNVLLNHAPAPPRSQLPEKTGKNTGPRRPLQRRNSEPDYANLPVIAHIRSGKIMTLDDPVIKQDQCKISGTVGKSPREEANGEVKSADSLRSGDSLSPAEYSNRQDTPSSVRSRSTQDSSHSHTSEGLPDQGYEDSEDSSVFSTPSPKTKQRGTLTPPLLSMETQHASLKRKKIPEKLDPVLQATLEKSLSMQTELAQRPLSMVLASQSEVNVIVNPATASLQRQYTRPRPVIQSAIDFMPNSSLMCCELYTPTPRRKLVSESDIESYAVEHLNTHKKGLFGRKQALSTMLTWSKTDIEQFALENLNEHRKGILGKTVPMANMLTWTKDVIQKPMIRTNDKMVKKEAPEVFKMIQMYMTDRKAKAGPPQIALDICTRAWSAPGLRDEVYMQLCRQTTDNKRSESLMRGWELMGICLALFSPSVKFHSYLEGYIYRHLDPGCDTEKVPVSHFAAHCQRRLERISQSGAKKGLRKPTIEEVQQAKKSIFHPSMFGSMLEDVLLMQKDRFPDRKLPWIQIILSEEVLRLHGAQTEGIFRVPGDIDEVNALKLKCDQWIPPTNCPDPHIPASLLKLWYRELHDPLIPAEFYDQCIENYANEETAINIVNSLPQINRLVLCYLIRFLQVFAAQENAAVTKMDVNNLAMVMAPNCLRCESDDTRIILQNTRKEMAFIRTLIQHLDTSFMEGVI